MYTLIYPSPEVKSGIILDGIIRFSSSWWWHDQNIIIFYCI